MLDILKQIILDNQEHEFRPGIPRLVSITPIPGKATVCIGPRRSGKSTYLFQRIQMLLRAGVAHENILYLNFFDDRLRQLQRDGLASTIEAYFSLYPEKKNAQTVYCFFDEIQVVPEWESFVDRLMRTENCEVFITGSSAQMLSQEIATQMRGRALSWELFPFSFREFLEFRNLSGIHPLSSKREFLVRRAFEEYFEAGGFPEVAGLERQLRIKVHQEYWSAMLFRDLIERHNVAHPRAVADLGHWLIDNAAALYTVNRLTTYLKTLGHRLTKSTVSNYLNWFEDAFFLFSVHVFDASVTRTKVNPKKVYCIDQSLVASVSSGILVNSGHLLENIVFVALRRLSPSIHYYKSKAGREVDFVVTLNGQLRLVQVCESLHDPNTRKREITALRDAMAELDLSASEIVVREGAQVEETEIDGRHIRIVPAWRFLLDLEACAAGS